MDEQKRLLLAVVLSVVVLVGYQTFFVKPPEPNNQPQQVQNQTTEQPQAQDKRSNVTEYKAEQNTAKTAAPPQVVKPQRKEYRTISVSTPLYNIAISEYGAAVKGFELKRYRETNKKDSPLKQLVPKQLVSGTILLGLEEKSVPGLKDAVYTAKIDADETLVSQGEKTIEFIFETPQGIVVKKIFTFKADSYLIDCDIVFQWSGFTEQYFLTAVMPQKAESINTTDTKLKLSFVNDIVTSSYIQKMDRLDPGKQADYAFTFYMGPKSLKVFGHYDNSLKNAINFGFFNVIAKPLLIVMNTIHGVIPNYGVAIILLTIFIKLIFWPLGTKSYRSMNKMKKVQPLMTELREKYKDDKQKMNQEVMALYKTYKVNPASGCLPMVVQMPIFFALYRMLYQAIELRHAPFFGWISDLSAPDRLFDLNFAIPMMQKPYGIPMLTLLMGASFLLQQKMTPTTGDPMQAKMMMLMPIFMTVLFINFPAGLVLYMFVNNLISMGQQYYIQKKFA